MLKLIPLAFVEIEPWMQFGLAGVTFITLATIVVMLIRKMFHRDNNSVNVDIMMKVREETLIEVNKRDEMILELSYKTLDGLHNSSRAMERMNESIDELTEAVERLQSISKRCQNNVQ